MRVKLAPYVHKRLPFRATFAAQFRTRGSLYPVRMALLTDVKLHGELVTDHVWINCGVEFDPDDFRRGDEVRFTARVEPYLKGYVGRNEDGARLEMERDLKLAYPLDVRHAGQPEQGQTTLESVLSTWRERGY